MVAGGAALARDDTGRVVFVDGALPGEIVTARLTETRVDFARAVAVDILEPSPDRVFPPCPALAAGCGGCSWQHIAPAAQVKLKAGIVVDALRRIGHLREPPEPTVVALDGPALRTTARLAVSPGGRAGYRPRGEPGQAVETDSCLAAHPLVEELIVAGCYPGAAEVLLRAAVASGERMVRVSPRGVVDQVRVPSGVVVLAEGDRGAAVHETVAARPFQISVDSFFQSGPVAAAGLGAAVLDALDNVVSDGGHVVDAYAGVGLFASLIGARLKARVTAIEIGRSAVADARVNLADVDARVLSLDVDKWRPRRGDHPIEAVVADPPRSGLGRSGSSAVVGARSPRIVLVSCDPASLGRDTALLRRAGYNLASVAVIDAFPHTSHVETVSRFDRGAKESIAGE
jgi:tRNA/tmRNA/rRNA uracil-C5-methylase (TrmA/RlmC/RlmD family)